MKRFTLFALLAVAVLILCAAPVQAQLVSTPQMFGLRSTSTTPYSTTISLDSVAAHSADTLRLARAQYSNIKIRGRCGTSDTLTYISNGIPGRMYLFQVAAQDTAIVFYKGGNIATASHVVLNDTNSVALFWYDGKNFRLISSALNH